MVNIKPSDYMVGIVFFLLFLGGSMYLIAEFAANDSDFIADTDRYNELNKSFHDYYEDMDSKAADMESRSTAGELDTEDSVWGGLLRTGWSAIGSLFNGLSFMGDFFNLMGSMFSVPGWIIGLALMLIAILIAVGIFSAIFQREI